MEAKDTVMNYEERNSKLFGTETEELAEDILLEAQAEISFKVGIKEVVDWMESVASRVGQLRSGDVIESLKDGTVRIDFIRINLLYSEWQTKLKEWGI